MVAVAKLTVDEDTVKGPLMVEVANLDVLMSVKMDMSGRSDVRLGGSGVSLNKEWE